MPRASGTASPDAAPGAPLGASSTPVGGSRGALSRLLHGRRHAPEPTDEEAPTTPRRASESDAHAGGDGGAGGGAPQARGGRLSHLFARRSGLGQPPSSPGGSSGAHPHRTSAKSVSRAGTDGADAGAAPLVLPEHAAKLVGV